MRGEYISISTVSVCSSGSPPHAWGIFPALPAQTASARFTPTCVGNIQTPLSSSPQVTVHPHMRGEYLQDQDGYIIIDGSPPHAWGILITTPKLYKCYRFTPTCVGNIFNFEEVQDVGAVHPHMRGEYAMKLKTELVAFGSPPHAWGI